MKSTAAEISAALGGLRRGNGFMALCPAHNDKNPSLSVKETEAGKILIYCFAGCDSNLVIEELKLRGLWHQVGEQ